MELNLKLVSEKKLTDCQFMDGDEERLTSRLESEWLGLIAILFNIKNVMIVY